MIRFGKVLPKLMPARVALPEDHDDEIEPVAGEQFSAELPFLADTLHQPSVDLSIFLFGRLRPFVDDPPRTEGSLDSLECLSRKCRRFEVGVVCRPFRELNPRLRLWGGDVRNIDNGDPLVTTEPAPEGLDFEAATPSGS